MQVWVILHEQKYVWMQNTVMMRNTHQNLMYDSHSHIQTMENMLWRWTCMTKTQIMSVNVDQSNSQKTQEL